MPKTCYICGSSKVDNKELSLFAVPKSENERNIWSKYLKMKIPEYGFVCSSHFELSWQIPQKRRKVLKKQFLNYSTTEKITEEEIITSSESRPSTSQTADPIIHIEDPVQSKNPFLNDDGPDTANPKILNFQSSPNCHSLFDCIFQNETVLLLPPLWACHKLEDHIVYSKLKKYSVPPQIEKSISIDRCLNSFIYINERKIKCPSKFKIIISADDLQELIFKIDRAPITLKKKKVITCYKNKFHYVYKKKLKLEEAITNIRKEKVDENKLTNFIKKLPDIQKELIEACVEAAEKNKHGVRYTLNWVYSCILMRIKSPKLYDHIRRENIMPLPSFNTLLRYIKKIDSNFGFKMELFNVIKEKTQALNEYEKHGSLLIDECKITPTKRFNKCSMELFGFVELGSHTPQKDKNQLGDHILVFMFQPFAGKAIQALACFLTKGNVTGNVQSKLVLECVVLCENAGLHIDIVTSDGATWNRSMWREFGIVNTLQPWCTHPTDENRLLRFASDYPHLVKCLRNLLVAKRQFNIPEGIVKHSHFATLMSYEGTKNFRIAPKLTEKHIWPKQFEKMSTKIAFQLFSNSVAIGLDHYRTQIEQLKDSDATIQFCLRINKITDIMNSSSPINALKYNSDEYKELENFLVYLNLWEQSSPQEYFLSKSTADGFKATISCTLNLVVYLTEEIGFKYLMTSRINQDALEHFFGMMRGAGGCNSHPESLQVAQIFRLMSLYSLVKPPRGSNITGGEMMKTLLDVQTLKNFEKKPFRLNIYLTVDDNVGLHTEEFYDNKEAFAYLCGYLARKYKNIKCSGCKVGIFGNGNESFNSVIANKSRGFLTYPSEYFYNFLVAVEVVLSGIFKTELEKNALTSIIEKLNNHKFSYLLGCNLHSNEFTQEVLRDFIILRLTITCQKENRKRKSQSKNQHYTKLAKLY